MFSALLPDKVMLVQNSYNPIVSRQEQLNVQGALPVQAPDYVEEAIDFNQFLLPNPLSTFVVRMKGDSMIDAHIPNNAIVLVDRNIEPMNHQIVLARVNGEFTIKRLIRNGSGTRLMPANEKYPPIPITDKVIFEIIGTVTNVIIEF